MHTIRFKDNLLINNDRSTNNLFVCVLTFAFGAVS